MARDRETHDETWLASGRDKSRNLWAACIVHALHDGYTDSLYAFLPIWQTQFQLSYAGLAVIRSLYYATMGGLQIPANRLLRHLKPCAALAIATLVAAAGFLIMALPLGFTGLCVGLVIAGFGSSIQHPRGSMLVAETYGEASRRPLGIYNFSGDLGKAVLPAFAALLLPLLAWRPILALMALVGLGTTGALMVLAPTVASRSRLREERSHAGHARRRGFVLLTVIGGLDTATRMGYLLFLPFLVQERDGGSASVGVALALLFVGGALGKVTSTWLSERLGVVGSVVATEAATALLIGLTLFTPLGATLVVLFPLGVFLNGTSSILYGTVPELATGDASHAFAIFYTSVIGSGGIAPILYGAIADHSSQFTGVVASALTAAAVIPMVLALRPALDRKA
nr:MFS transporter [Consotaella salsifontis]